MGNTENMENTENVDLEALTANGGEPEDTEDDIARREEALKKVEEYYKLIQSGEYYVRVLDPNREPTVQALTVQPEDEACLTTHFELKALQNSKNISPLNWDSIGNKGNLYVEADEWDRIGVSCCATGTSDTPGFVQSYSEHILNSSDTHGNKNFKAVMVKADYQVIVPAYSEVTLSVTMNIRVFKKGGRTSCTWLGAFISDKDTWTTIVAGNGNWADNNGIIKSDNPADHTFAEGCGMEEELMLILQDYNCGTQKNTTDTARLWKFTLYIMGNIEKSSTINQRLLLFDRKNDIFRAVIKGAVDITYDPNGGEMRNGRTTQKLSFDSDNLTGGYLYKATKTGYRLAGWKDALTGRLYAAGGLYREKRGMKLTALWVPETVTYHVEHILQNIDGTYPATPTESETLKGTAGTEATPDAKEYQGFYTPDCSTVVISEDGTTVVQYRYVRRTYKLRFLANGGKFKGLDQNRGDYMEQTIPYGEKMRYPELESRRRYSFLKWSESYTTMPDHDVTIRANWQENT